MLCEPQGIPWCAPGYGINYANGQYAKFIQDFAFQPPFADVQTNVISAQTTTPPFTLANGFPTPEDEQQGNYAVNKYYRLPYVQVWNINLQRTLPLGIVLNIGYNGSKGTRLDIVNAPGRTATESLSGVFYDYEDSVAFSNYNALTVSARKRLQRGIGWEPPTPTAIPSTMPVPSAAAAARFGGGAELAGPAGRKVKFELRYTPSANRQLPLRAPFRS